MESYTIVSEYRRWYWPFIKYKESEVPLGPGADGARVLYEIRKENPKHKFRYRMYVRLDTGRPVRYGTGNCILAMQSSGKGLVYIPKTNKFKDGI